MLHKKYDASFQKQDSENKGNKWKHFVKGKERKYEKVYKMYLEGK